MNTGGPAPTHLPSFPQRLVEDRPPAGVPPGAVGSPYRLPRPGVILEGTSIGERPPNLRRAFFVGNPGTSIGFRGGASSGFGMSRSSPAVPVRTARPRLLQSLKDERAICLRIIPSASSRSGRPNGSGTRPSARSTSTRGPSSISSTCSPTPAARACTSATPRATPPPISSADTSGCAGSTSCTRWAGTPSACPPSSTPSRTNVHPRDHHAAEHQRRSAARSSRSGFSYDWDREVDTTDPNYYKWTQWIFLQIYDTWYDPDYEWTDRRRPTSPRQGPADRRAADPAGHRRSRRLSRLEAPGLSRRGPGQLVPRAGDRAGQ